MVVGGLHGRCIMGWLKAVIHDSTTFVELTEKLRLDCERCAHGAGSSPCIYASFERQEIVWNDTALALFDAFLALDHVEDLAELPSPEVLVRLSPAS